MLRLKEIRNENRYSQQKLSEQLGVSRSTVAMWENGSSQPRADILPELAKVLQCKIDDLYSEST